MTRLLVVGATGLVGSEVIKLAYADKRITKIVALTRRPLPAHEKLENHVVNFDAIAHDAPFFAVDAAICALGTTRGQTASPADYRKIDVLYPIMIAERSKQGGAKTYGYVSSVGAKSSSPFSYLRGKGEVEAALSAMNYFSVTIARPSFIAGRTINARPSEHRFLSLLQCVEHVLPKRWRSISAERIARALVENAVAPRQGVHIRESETL